MSALDGPAVAVGDGERVAGQLRTGLLVLAALGIAGTVGELTALRHWESEDQLIPWFILAALAVAVGLVAFAPDVRRVRFAQLLGLGSLLGGAYGVLEHVHSNLESGPLDATYGPKWDTMGTVSKWWAAASGGVGPAPSLAPAILAQIGLCLLLATWAHPVLRDRVARRGSGG